MKLTYTTKGTCSKYIDIEYDPDTKIINSIEFIGGCPGNLSALSTLLTGKTAQDIIAMFDGARCGLKITSCMDQLAQALKEIL